MRARSAGSKQARSWLAALVALAVLFCVCVSLLRFQHTSAGAQANQRTNRLERFGSAANVAVNAAPDLYFNSIEMGVINTSMGVLIPSEPTSDATASWDMLNYEFGHLFSSDPPCTLSMYILADDPIVTGVPSFIDISLNGRKAESIALTGGAVRGAIPFEHAVSTQALFFTPLYQPSGFLVPVKWNGACHSNTFAVGIHVHNARWKIGRLGIIANYTPLRPAFVENRAVVFAGLLVLFGLAIAFLALFAAVCRRFGLFALAVLLVVVLASTLSHDQWDFPVWVRFVDLLAFGHGNPVIMWGEFPIWPYLTSIVAPIAIAAYSLFDFGGQEVSVLLLKLFLALAYCFTAYLIAGVADARTRKMIFLIALLSPAGLYELAAGYREIAGGLLAVVGLLLTLRRRYAFSTIAFVAAGAISEALLPLTMLPAAMVMVGWRAGGRAILGSLLYAGFAVCLVAVQWLTLPRGQLTASVAFRTSSYRFGGASWHSILEAYGVPLQFVREHGLATNLLVLALLAVPFLIKYIMLLRREPRSERDTLKAVLYVFLGFEFAFYLSYTGVDPSTWYALLVVVLFVLTVTDAFHPYPLILSASMGLAFYSIVGLGDFVNWTYLWPIDVGLFGIIGQPIFVFVGISNLLILCGLIAALVGDFRILIGPRTLWFALVFACACVASTIFQYPQDIVLVVGFAGLAGTFVVGLTRVYVRRAHANGGRDLQLLAVPVAVGCTLELVSRTSLWYAWLGLALVLLAIPYGVGLIDVVAIVGTMWLLWTEPGAGWLSMTGYYLLIVSVLSALWSQRRFVARDLWSRLPRLPLTLQWDSAVRFSTEKPAPPVVVERREMSLTGDETKLP